MIWDRRRPWRLPKMKSGTKLSKQHEEIDEAGRACQESLTSIFNTPLRGREDRSGCLLCLRWNNEKDDRADSVKIVSRELRLYWGRRKKKKWRSEATPSLAFFTEARTKSMESYFNSWLPTKYFTYLGSVRTRPWTVLLHASPAMNPFHSCLMPDCSFCLLVNILRKIAANEVRHKEKKEKKTMGVCVESERKGGGKLEDAMCSYFNPWLRQAEIILPELKESFCEWPSFCVFPVSV